MRECLLLVCRYSVVPFSNDEVIIRACTLKNLISWFLLLILSFLVLLGSSLNSRSRQILWNTTDKFVILSFVCKNCIGVSLVFVSF